VIELHAAGSAAFAEVNSAGASSRAVEAGGRRRGAIRGTSPVVAHRMAVGGAKVAEAHSCGTAGVGGAHSLLQRTASCFISPLAGERRASIDPTNPDRTE